MRAAAQLDVLDRGFATCGVGTHVVELQPTAFSAATARAADECAARAVAHPHRALDLVRDVARAWLRTLARARCLRRPELLLREVLQQEVQRPIEDLRDVPVR